MMISFCIAVGALLLGAWGWKAALDIPSAAGAGAAGSMVLLGSGICFLISLISFGVTIGLAISH